VFYESSISRQEPGCLLRALLWRLPVLSQGPLPRLPREREGRVVPTKEVLRRAPVRDLRDCKEFADAKDCRHFNTFIAKTMSLLFNSNRPAGVRKIRDLGTEGFAAFMAERKLMKLPRRGG